VASSYTFRSITFAISLLSLGVASAEESKLAELLKRAPSPANAIAYIHNPSLHKLMSDAGMPSSLSEHVDQVWLVSELDRSSLQPRWEAGYGILTQNITAEQLAKSTGGYVDSVADKQVVWSPRQMYLVPTGENRIGFLRPANRSELSKWLVPGLNINYSEFLSAQSQQPENFLSLMIALDLKDSFSPIPMAQRITNFKSLKSRVPKDVADILASANGLKIIVGRRSLNECIFTIEFSKNPETLLSIANELLAEILDRNGTSAPEVLSWKTKLDGNNLSFQGPISQSSLDGLLGIFTLRDQAEEVAGSARSTSSATRTSTDNTAYTSKNYFDKVVATVERVRKYESNNTGSRARWNDVQARRLDELSTLNADPEIVEYGMKVADLLRNNALSVRTTNYSANQAKVRQGVDRGVYSNEYGYGYSNAYNVTANQIVTDSDARTIAVTDFTVTLATIDKLTADTRRAMTEKFKIQF
jgi:hypothetical protein